MSRIAEATRITPKEVAESLELSTPAVTAVTTTLVGRGLVVRSVHPHDRRSLLLELTPEGHRMMEGTYTAFQAAITAACQGLAEDHVAQLEGNLSALARSMSAGRDINS